MDNRGTSSVVGKLLGAGLVLLYVSGSTAVLLGDVVPGARRATGQELADRVVGDAAARLERTLEPGGGHLRGTVSLDLPSTIAGAGYSLRLRGGELHLKHPDPGIDARAHLETPSAVSASASTIQSGSEGAIVVSGPTANRTVRLIEEEP
ncbi:MAG: hypothetical protein V5A24_01655 [Haloarculaceae archaeon]